MLTGQAGQNPISSRASAAVAGSQPSFSTIDTVRSTSFSFVADTPASIFRLSSMPTRTWPPRRMDSVVAGS